MKKDREELTRGRATLAVAERSRADLEKLNKQLERRVDERTAELIAANQALRTEMDERSALEEQLRQAQKMESMGTLAGGIAHDFNNILNIIQGYSSLIAAQAGESTDIPESVKIINEAIKRGAGVVQQLLTMARKTEANLELTDLNAVVSSLVDLVKGTFPKNIAVHLELAAGLPMIMADPNQINQALLNLCVNARDAMPNGGRLTLRTAFADAGALDQRNDGEEAVAIEVSDSGTGIDEKVRERIFEPFFTTKDADKGTGLGLSVVYGIVKSHRGTVAVTSAPGDGSTFRIVLPRGNEPCAEPSDPHGNGAEKHNGATGTALVVEDEETMLHLLRNLLAERGYRVFTAVDGEEATARYRRNGDDIDVVLLDLDLPKISGTEVLRKIRAKNPAARVVVTSGHLEPELKAALAREGVSRFVHKPYVPQEVVAALDDLPEAGNGADKLIR
jgi:signal transduction histidine kinase/ActR/RegA family two-component response regulator